MLPSVLFVIAAAPMAWATPRDDGGAAALRAFDAALVPVVDFDLAAQSAGESAGTVDVGVTLSEASALDVTIPYTLSGTALDPEDYGVDASPLVILAGATTGSITVTVVDDGLDEADETVVVTLGTPTNATLGTTTEHTLTITDDDAPPSVTFDLASQAAGEETGTATIGLTLSAASGQDVTVPFTVTGSASDPDDYTIDASPAVIPAGATTASVSVALVDDGLDEADETVVVTLGTPTNATLGATPEHTLTITDDDGPSVTFDFAGQVSGEGVGAATIGLTLSESTIQDVTIPFTVTGSAIDPDDYGIDASPVVILAGDTTAALSVTLVDDALDEADESVVVTLGTPTNATLGAIAEHTLTIVDDDAPPSVTFDLASQGTGEEVGSATISLTLSAASGQDVTVPFAVTGSASDPDDYGIDASPVVILAGATTADVAVTLVDDGLDEPDETVVVTLGTPTNATLGATTEHTLTIVDDDDPPSVTFDLAGQSTGEETGTATIGLTLSVVSGQDVTLPYTVGGSADDPDDYGIDASPVVIPAGDTAALVAVTPVDDALDEDDETVVVTLGTPTNATLGAIGEHTVVLLDDDPLPLVEFAVADGAALESDGAVAVEVSLSTVSGRDVTVPYSVSGTALDPDDYGIDAGPLVVPAGAPSASLAILVLDDTTDEPDETVVIDLGTPVNADLGPLASHVHTIVDDDDPPTIRFKTQGQEEHEDDASGAILVQLSQSSGFEVVVTVALTGTATLDEDYTFGDLTVTIPPGETSGAFSFASIPDSVVEGDETIVVGFDQVQGATIGVPTPHTVTLHEDDLFVEFALASRTVNEEGGTIDVEVTLSEAWTSDIVVLFQKGGDATLGDDYDFVAETATILAGDTSGVLQVVLLDDLVPEFTEDLELTLREPDNAALGDIRDHTITILDTDPERIQVNEFLALNDSWLDDEDGSDSDWIEIHSSFLTPIDLDGYYLTDDVAFPTKWQFPATPIAPGGYLVVFASAKDRAISGQELHTNFELSGGGEYLALVAPDGTTVVSEYFPAYPEQFTNVSYGLDPSTLAPEYFAPPTPGEPNGEPGLPLPPVLVSLDRGLYDSPQTLILSHPTSGATIRYTTDGSVPTETTGTVYSAPLSVTGTTCIRASAFLEGFAPSPPVTRTYIFPAEVPDQSDAYALARGFPADWITKDGENWTEGKEGGRPGAWYGFDAQVLQKYTAAELEQMLAALPSVSLVMSIDDWFGDDPDGPLGIYCNSEEEDGIWERPGSIEWIDGAGGPEFGVDCLLKIQGNGSTRPETRNQLSIATKFKGQVGPSKLEFPLFEDSEVDRFDYLVFDAGNQYSINGAAPSDTGYNQKRHAQVLRDQFAMELLGAAGHPTQHGRFVHLYLNGLYWGVYNLHERADEHYGAEHFGGEDEEYDYLKGGVIENGNSNPWDDPTAPGAWPTVIAIAENGVGPNDTWQGEPAFEALDDLIDLEGYIDYVLLNFWLANRDWPASNHIQNARARLGPGLDDVNPDLEFKFFTWDSENVMPKNSEAMLIGDGVHDRSDITTAGLQNALFLHTALLQNPEYPMLVADRAWRLMREGGALHVDPDYSGIGTPFDPEHPERNRPAALYYSNTVEVQDVIDLEYARWGDYWPLSTKITIQDWQDERTRLLNDFCAFRTSVFLEQLRTGVVLYPSIDPPLFSQNGGCVDASFTLELLPQQAGDVYYTLDGSDPRAPGGGLSGSALPYVDPFLLPDTITRVRARSRSGSGEWSALNGYPFAVDAKVIRINEFLAENQHDIVDEAGEHEDWIELYNTNEEAIDLAGWTLSDDPQVPGKWAFPAGTVIGPQGYLVVWADNEPADGPLHATFRLKKGGETIALHLPAELEHVTVDSVLFGPQVPDVSSGRTPNGSGPFRPYPNPTPGAPNVHRQGTPELAPGGG